jgi:hypothetical protein
MNKYQKIEHDVREIAKLCSQRHDHITESILLAAADIVKQAHFDSQAAIDNADWFDSLVVELAAILNCDKKATSVIKETKALVEIDSHHYNNLLELQRGLSKLEKLINDDAHLKYQDNKWWLFWESSGESAANGQATIEKLIVAIGRAAICSENRNSLNK